MPIEKTKRKSGVRFRSRIMINNNQFTSPWFLTRREAEDWEAEKRVEVKNSQVNTGSSITLAEYLKIWLEKHAYPYKTFGAALRDDQYFKKHVLPTLGGTPLRKITSQQIAFLFGNLHRKGEIQPKTINNVLGSLKKALKDAVTWGYISSSPAEKVPRFKVSEREIMVFTPDEIARLLVFTKDQYLEEHLLILFALNTGCRLGEIVGLRWSRVDFELKFATIDTIYEEKTKKFVQRTKGKRVRRVPLNDGSIRLLKDMALEGRKNESEYLFHRISYYAITHAKFRRILRRAGLKSALADRKTFHCLRHTFASEFMRTGGRLSDLQQLLGHSTIKQTEKYVHFAPDYLAGMTQRVSFGVPEGRVVPLVARGF